ncbi:hypothetical protein PghCCS26_36210 [Paenibacillus glycanilyticus]|uniref:Uncharacterized protein n=1 Tax=Paenibacillus glycanilyticus TaxID=126569 RepID=A0ABQ6NQI7_9BACL|nr:hypothetical protein PghCCS26_36210 [Paenibacillus glycanilyticus]
MDRTVPQQVNETMAPALKLDEKRYFFNVEVVGHDKRAGGLRCLNGHGNIIYEND